jgi:hypothetical protein
MAENVESNESTLSPEADAEADAEPEADAEADADADADADAEPEADPGTDAGAEDDGAAPLHADRTMAAAVTAARDAARVFIRVSPSSSMAEACRLARTHFWGVATADQ